MKSCADIIRELRQDNDLKQLELAKLLGTSQQHYSNYETGTHELPLRALITLADFYGVSTDYLTGRTACREGVDALNKKVDSANTSGAVISDILSLGEKGRAYVLESIYLQKLKETVSKDGRRHR